MAARPTDRGSIPGARLCVTAPTSAVGPTGGRGIRSREVNRPEHEADYHQHLVPR